MSNLTVFATAGLPSVGDLTAALRRVETTSGVGEGGAHLKMDKTGHWVFGSDQTEVEPDSVWAVNPFSFTHGFIAWAGDKTPAKGTVLGEVMVPITQPLPETGEVPEHCDKGWQVQIGVSMQCITGEDAGLSVRFNTISQGGKKALTALGLAIAAQVEKDPEHPVPLLLLKKESYQHKVYGRIFTPLLEVTKWVAMDKEPDPADAAEVPDATPERRRRRAA
tara:strand:- start:4013 stop:4675 length:663 start_codon:yes stop_codon:yes gene_type:complete